MIIQLRFYYYYFLTVTPGAYGTHRTDGDHGTLGTT
jgi:hypothetical protein